LSYGMALKKIVMLAYERGKRAKWLVICKSSF
jgi:hypothetical protein